MISTRSNLVLIACAAILSAGVASAQTKEKGKLNQYGNPMKIPPRPTKAAIDEADLRTRLYVFADDSMMGRQINTLGNKMGTDYIAAEVKRLGLEPAGDNGTYFQIVPFAARYYSPESQISVAGRSFKWGEDVASAQGSPLANRQFMEAQVIYGGVVGDTANQIALGMAVGRFVILTPNPNPPAEADGGRGGRGGGGGGGGGRGGRGGFGGGGGQFARFIGATAIAVVDLDQLDAAQRTQLIAPPQRATMQNPPPPVMPGQTLGAADAPLSLRITRNAAEALLGVPLAGLKAGAAGKTASGRFAVAEKKSEHPEYARNVVAILRGSDPTLRNEYVAIGAHNDHVGLSQRPVDHDSVEAVLNEVYKMRMADGKTVVAGTQAMTDSALKLVDMKAIRKANGPGRPDSIRNGADDDGSGSMAVLEIAEALVNAPEKPKRSIIFVWHTGEESGLQGSQYFTSHPTVPRESIVAQINIDMIGRGRADDLPGGGPDYLSVVGANMLSADLGKAVADINAKQAKPLKLDYQFDEPSLWAGYNNIYGRSDHYNYARFNIPIAFFFTGLHRDYHQVTDEPQYIDYPHYTRIVNYIRDLMVAVGNGPRPKLKGPAQ